jgi:hypothetical protein
VTARKYFFDAVNASQVKVYYSICAIVNGLDKAFANSNDYNTHSAVIYVDDGTLIDKFAGSSAQCITASIVITIARV